MKKYLCYHLVLWSSLKKWVREKILKQSKDGKGVWGDYHFSCEYDKVFLYAPTFNDRGAEFLEKLKFDVKEIQSAYEKNNILFLIKMHPLCSLKISQYKST